MTTPIQLIRAQTSDTTYTLVAGVAKVLVFDLGEAAVVAATFINTGVTNAIGTTVVELGLTNEDASYQIQTAVGAAIGSIAATAKGTYGKFNDVNRFVRFTFTSSSGTTLRLQVLGL